MTTLHGAAWLLVMQLLGEVIARTLRLPIPGPVLGMALLVPALTWPPLRQSVEGVARFLLEHLSLLFVPVGVGVVTHLDTLEAYGLRLAAVIVLSTWIGMAVTALVLRALLRRGARAEGADHA